MENSTIASIHNSLQHEELDTNRNEEIIEKLRAEIAELRSVNSGLALRAYMAEKKVV